MTQEIKKKLEQGAETAWEQDKQTNPSPVNPHAYVYGYKAGAKTILENPHEWGLADMDEITQAHLRYFKAVRKATKYGEALERIIMEAEDNEQVDWMYIAENMVEIAKEALKQEANNDL